jgi:squalene synthase HpnC
MGMVAPLELSPPAIPDARAVMGRMAGENFPVAAHVLSRRDRRHLLALYGFARLADELGDDFVGDRLAALDWLEQELGRAYAGTSKHVLLQRLQATVSECALPREPFLRLIEANRVDQRVRSYETWGQLLSYCELSANPIGELVLGVFGLATAARIALSNRICTALQLTEHWQDVGEDIARGRTYLPARDLERFGCPSENLADALNSAQGDARERLRRTIAFEARRTREVLDSGAPLLETIGGRRKAAVAAFVAGGRAALDAIERARFEVLSGAPRANRMRRLLALASVLAESRR